MKFNSNPFRALFNEKSASKYCYNEKEKKFLQFGNRLPNFLSQIYLGCYVLNKLFAYLFLFMQLKNKQILDGFQ